MKPDLRGYLLVEHKSGLTVMADMKSLKNSNPVVKSLDCFWGLIVCMRGSAGVLSAAVRYWDDCTIQISLPASNAAAGL